MQGLGRMIFLFQKRQITADGGEWRTQVVRDVGHSLFQFSVPILITVALPSKDIQLVIEYARKSTKIPVPGGNPYESVGLRIVI